MKFVPLKARYTPQPSTPPIEICRRILYVEDEDINWEIAAHNLEQRYSITRARNGREVFERLSKNSYDVILMDIQLSGSDLNGLDIARILKGLYHGHMPAYARGVHEVDTPIVFVTAYTARYKKQEVLDAGGEALMPKPVNFTLLAIVINSVLARRSIAVSRLQNG